MKKIFTAIICSILFSAYLCMYSYAQSTPSNAEKYASECQDLLDEMAMTGISMEIANTKSDLKMYFESIIPIHDEDIQTDVVITENIYGGPGSFVAAIKGTKENPYGKNGRFGIRIFIKSSEDNSESMASKLFRIKAISYYDEDLENYIQQCREIYYRLHNVGISAQIANTPAEVEEYLYKIIPKEVPENVEITVWVHGYREENPHVGYFVEAINGTPNNPIGLRGGVEFSIRIYDSIKKEQHKVGGYVRIMPIPYYEGDLSSDDPDTYYQGDFPEEINILKSSVYSGEWIRIGNKWKLKLEDGSYANMQWAQIDNEWYVFGKDGYMLTGWNKINGNWYLISKNGNMLIGWQKEGENWYYFEPSGIMLTDTITPDGYRINKKGIWIQ